VPFGERLEIVHDPVRDAPRLLALLVADGEAGVEFPQHGMVALVSEDEGDTWREIWRVV